MERYDIVGRVHTWIDEDGIDNVYDVETGQPIIRDPAKQTRWLNFI